MDKSKNQEFIIKFNGVALSEEASLRIQNGINNLILQELAGYQLKIDGNTNATASLVSDDYCAVYIPHKWIGREVLRFELGDPSSIERPDSTLGFIAPL
jgi:hypothetical protein